MSDHHSSQIPTPRFIDDPRPMPRSAEAVLATAEYMAVGKRARELTKTVQDMDARVSAGEYIDPAIRNAVVDEVDALLATARDVILRADFAVTTARDIESLT